MAYKMKGKMMSKKKMSKMPKSGMYMGMMMSNDMKKTMMTPENKRTAYMHKM